MYTFDDFVKKIHVALGFIRYTNNQSYFFLYNGINNDSIVEIEK